MKNWTTFIFDKKSGFNDKALAIFDYQYQNNAVYRRFCDALGRAPEGITNYMDIPLFPIRGFKDTKMSCKPDQEAELLFESSGTSGMERSRHYIENAEHYRQSLLKGFSHFYPLKDLVIWGYTPGYNDNPQSSLIWMINALIQQDESGMSRVLELNQPLNEQEIKKVKNSGKRLMIFGAAFGLLDLVELKKVKLSQGSYIMETGGMKTHRREISRYELHRNLADGFGLPKEQVHSEYGMTELLSQAYALGGKWFTPVPWMKVSIFDPDDPLKRLHDGEVGLIGVTDLANVHSCSFILTGDKGVQRRDGKFQVLGRWKPENLRGCNFLVEQE